MCLRQTEPVLQISKKQDKVTVLTEPEVEDSEGDDSPFYTGNKV